MLWWLLSPPRFPFFQPEMRAGLTHSAVIDSWPYYMPRAARRSIAFLVALPNH